MSQLLRPLEHGEKLKKDDIYYSQYGCNQYLIINDERVFDETFSKQIFRPVTIPPYEEIIKSHSKHCQNPSTKCPTSDMACRECLYNFIVEKVELTKAKPTPPKKDNSLKTKSATAVYFALVCFVIVGYFFFITCVK